MCGLCVFSTTSWYVCVALWQPKYTGKYIIKKYKLIAVDPNTKSRCWCGFDQILSANSTNLWIWWWLWSPVFYLFIFCLHSFATNCSCTIHHVLFPCAHDSVFMFSIYCNKNDNDGDWEMTVKIAFMACVHAIVFICKIYEFYEFTPW